MTRSRSDHFSEPPGTRGRGRMLARAVAILLAAALAAQLVRVAFAAGNPASQAPDFALKESSGRNLRLSEYRSEVVAVAFWASWCGACREQLPVLEGLQQSLGPEGLRVLAVNFDEKPSVAQETAAAARVSFPVLLDAAGDVGRLYDVQELPMVVLVDRTGRLRGSYAGSDAADGREIDRAVRALLAE